MLDLRVYLVLDAATRASPTTGGAMTHLINCYCGSGLFYIDSSSHLDVCVGIEVNEISISEARENAASNGIENGSNRRVAAHLCNYKGCTNRVQMGEL